MNGRIIKLIFKDMKLLLQPVVIFFFVLSAGMCFIPSYPRQVIFFYVLVSLMQVFNYALQGRDHEFSGLLPVTKRESVLARVLLISIVELLLLIFIAPFALVVVPSVIPSEILVNHAGMNLNLTLFAIVLIGYSVFNLILITGGYKKQFKVNLRGFFALMSYMLVTLTLELLIGVLKRGGTFLNGTSGADMLGQLPILLGGLAFFALMNMLVYAIAARSYERAEI